MKLVFSESNHKAKDVQGVKPNKKSRLREFGRHFIDSISYFGTRAKIATVAAALVCVSCSSGVTDKNTQDTQDKLDSNISDVLGSEADLGKGKETVTKDNGVKDSSEIKDTEIEDLDVSDILKPETSPKDGKIEIEGVGSEDTNVEISDTGVGDGPEPDISKDVSEIKDVTYVDAPLDYGYEVEVSKDLQPDEVSTPSVKCWEKNTCEYGNGMRSVWQTKDGDYIAVGGSGCYSDPTMPGISKDVLFLELDPSGDIKFGKMIGGIGMSEGKSTQQTSDEGRIIAGEIFSDSPYVGYGWVVKLASDGNIQWENTYGTGGWNRFNAIQQTIDGGYIAAGDASLIDNPTNRDLWVVKLDASGKIEWQKTFGFSLEDNLGFSIHQTSDGGYITTTDDLADTNNPGSIVTNLLKLTPSGDLEWNKIHNENFGLYAIRQTTDGGYVGVGSNGDLTVIKFLPNGDLQWKKTYGDGITYTYPDTINVWDVGFSIQQTSDGGFISCGASESKTPTGWILKLNSNGDLEWDKTYGFDNADTFLWSIIQTSDGGYMSVGQVYGETPASLILKLDSNGNLENCE